jgi:hypothetical protein
MANPTIIVEYIGRVEKLVDSLKDVSRSSDTLGKSTKKIDWRGVANLAAGAAALGVGVKIMKDSADATEELAKSTVLLARATGLDIETASAWVSTLKVRGIEVSQFQTALVKLSKLMENSRKATEQETAALKEYNEVAAILEPRIAKGGKAGEEAAKEMKKLDEWMNKITERAQKARQPLEDLGVSQRDIAKGNVSAVLLQVADAFQKMKNPAEKAATAQQLFGRGGQRLVPILSAGAEGIQKQLDLAERYGAVVGEKQVSQVKAVAQAQRELKLAQQGVAISIGSALLPAQVLLWGVLLDVTQALSPLTDNMYVMVPAIVLATGAWVAYKIAAIAATIASIGLNASLLISIGIFAAVAIGLIALAAGVVILYKKWDWFHDLIQSIWQWIKRNWPYLAAALLGPFAVAAVAIYRNWDRIQDSAENAVNAIARTFARIKDIIIDSFVGVGTGAWNVINNIGEIVSGFYTTITGWGSSIGHWVKSGVVAGLLGIGTAAWGVINNIWEVASGLWQTIVGWGRSIGAWIKQGVLEGFTGIGTALANMVKAGLNAVLKAWNALKIPGFKIKGPGPLPDIHFPAVQFPNVPLLAKGGIVTGPTLAMLGESGPEAVVPLSGGRPSFDVRVFIGETELRGVVRSEIRSVDNATAQVLISRRM